MFMKKKILSCLPHLQYYFNQLIENSDTVEHFTKSKFTLPCLATKESYFIFNSLLYKQNDGVAMGSLFGPSLDDAFLP